MSDKKTRRKRERAQARRLAAESRASQEREKRARKAERRLRRDEVVAKAMRDFETVEEKFAKSDLPFDVKRVLLRRARKLVDPRFAEPLRIVTGSGWLRAIEDWKPKGKSPHSLFKSLTRHLLVQYTMPDFLFSVFFADDDEVRRVGVSLFRELGRGGSLHKAVKAGRFPVPFTKRMCHAFMLSTSRLDFLEAVRHAQVEVLGGDRRLAEAVSATRQLGRGFRPDEAFWSTVVQWTCAQAMLAPSQLGPIYDWIARQRQENPSFEMKGRTGVSVLRAVEEWHGELARERKINGHQYDPSGFEPWFAERKVRLPTGGHHFEKHCVTEISSSKELAAEGQALRHCVYSYSWSIQRGTTSIWSYRVDGERTLTIEVDNRTKRVVQCRGRANRVPAASEVAQVERWMKINGLVRAAWLPTR